MHCLPRPRTLYARIVHYWVHVHLCVHVCVHACAIGCGCPLTQAAHGSHVGAHRPQGYPKKRGRSPTRHFPRDVNLTLCMHACILGGDLRKKANRWLKDAYMTAKLGSIPCLCVCGMSWLFCHASSNPRAQAAEKAAQPHIPAGNRANDER